MMSPCKGCPDRSAVCHTNCEKYKTFQNVCEQRRKDARLRGDINEIITSSIIKKSDEVKRSRKK